MIGITNRDRSFFNIKPALKKGPILYNDFLLSPDEKIVSNEDVISLEITEEMGRMTSGSLVLNDPYNKYSRILRDFSKLQITWGYYVPDISPFSVVQLSKNPTEFSSVAAKRTILARVLSPSGSGSSTGQITYSCQFQSHVELGQKGDSRLWYTGTKSLVVREVAFSMMKVALMFVDFKRGNEVVLPDTPVRMDNESPFKFLHRKAHEWGASFAMGYTPSGVPALMFVDPAKVQTCGFLNVVLGAAGDNNLFEYMGGTRNVIDYTWRKTDGGGDNVQVQYVNGKPEYIYSRAQDETVTYWKLDFDAIKRYYKDRKQNISDLAAFTKKMLETDDFNEFVKRKFFVAAKSTTAPQGSGYEGSLNTLGNPLYTAGNKATFGEGFPSRMRQTEKAPIKFFMRKVTHSINRESYKNSIDFVDAYTVSGGSLVG